MKEVKLKGLYTACFYLYYILEKEKYSDRNQIRSGLGPGVREGNWVQSQIANKNTCADWPSDS